MTDPFQKLADSVAERLGIDAVLRPGDGDEWSGKVVFHQGVTQYGEQGEVVARRTVATLPSSESPKIGDELTAGGRDYVLDGLDSDDGYEARFFVRAG